ncbi:MAG: hypothetical protein M2R45_00579 [Verrucomicrobia subdivision 3 bacterium]|nr:hypothetical protein [Limisphaerales bacterium]MCS1413544.1 hypothetical protein [Limisphaerales bacterium]
MLCRKIGFAAIADRNLDNPPFDVLVEGGDSGEPVAVARHHFY